MIIEIYIFFVLMNLPSMWFRSQSYLCPR